MTREEATKRFNDLPKEHRVTVIADNCDQEIRWLEREKAEYIKAHRLNIKRINERIKTREEWLKKLKDQFKFYTQLLEVKNIIIKMEEKIKHQLRITKVREMTNPTILMNEKDLQTFIKQIESKVNNLKVGKQPMYEGIPILVGIHIEQGNLIIYDDLAYF